MSRILSPGYFSRPQPEIVNGKIYESKLFCQNCGEPGKWRPRVFGQYSVLGEVLCDKCNHSPGLDLDDLIKKDAGMA